MSHSIVTYHIGIPEAHRETAVQLYDEAFGQKIVVAVKDKRKRLKGISIN